MFHRVTGHGNGERAQNNTYRFLEYGGVDIITANIIVYLSSKFHFFEFLMDSICLLLEMPKFVEN